MKSVVRSDRIRALIERKERRASRTAAPRASRNFPVTWQAGFWFCPHTSVNTGGILPRQAPVAAVCAAKTGFLLRFSAAARRIKEFVGRGGLHCGGSHELTPHVEPKSDKLLGVKKIARPQGPGDRCLELRSTSTYWREGLKRTQNSPLKTRRFSGGNPRGGISFLGIGVTGGSSGVAERLSVPPGSECASPTLPA